jgi:hypothetical protein
MVSVTCVILDILLPDNRLRDFTVCGITESGEHLEQQFWKGEYNYPPEIVSLVPALVSVSESRAPEKIRHQD